MKQRVISKGNDFEVEPSKPPATETAISSENRIGTEARGADSMDLLKESNGGVAPETLGRES